MECKLTFYACKDKYKLCFILTIWNVNEYTACSLTKASNVLY
ncbi:TPA: hypothetical protein ACG3QM_004075 [Clostridioides difficile]